jgi:hypothetical protein
MYGSEDSSYNNDEDDTSAWDSESSIGTPNVTRSMGNTLDDENVESQDEGYEIKRNASNNNLNGDFGNIGMGSYGTVSAGENDKLLNVSVVGTLASGERGGEGVKRVNKKNRRKSSTKKLPSFHS